MADWYIMNMTVKTNSGLYIICILVGNIFSCDMQVYHFWNVSGPQKHSDTGLSAKRRVSLNPQIFI